MQNEAEAIAKRFEISATKLYRSNRFIKSIIKDNLHSQAKFIDLLNSIERFNENELEEFAKETNLYFIFIFSPDLQKVTKYYNRQVPYNHITEMLKVKLCNRLIFDKKDNLIYYIYKGKYSDSYVITGILAKKFFEKQRRFTTENLIQSIVNSRKEILNIEICNNRVNGLEISLKQNRYFEVTLPFHGIPNKSITVLIDATHGVRIINNFKHNLIVFVIFIFFTGIIVTCLIYFIQKRYLESINEYERKLFVQEKDAALGRSAALIAHEIRNPVNAVGIGLQRLQYELDLNGEYYKLIDTMIKELQKINNSIETFIDFTKPLKLTKENIRLITVINELLSLFKNSPIDTILQIPDDFHIKADRNLFTRVVLNLIKNAFENPKTGYLKIYIENNNLIFENNGIDEDNNIECDKIFEPYYTQKITGSGLGLAIVKKIVENHGWQIECRLDEDIIKFRIILS